MYRRFIHRIQRIVKCAWLGAGVYDKLKFVVAFGIFRLRKAGRSRQWTFRIRFGKSVHTIWLSDIFELGLVYEIFAAEEYALPDTDPKVIVDLGSNIGLSVLYFASRYPHAHIYACEPDPHAYERLVRHTASLPLVTTCNVAISDQDGMQEMFLNTDRSMSSSFIARDGSSISVRVPTRSLVSLCAEEYKIEWVDMLKFDIEGAEFDALKGGDTLQMVGSAVGEVHFDLIMPATRTQFLSLFSDFDVSMEPLEKRGRYILKAERTI